jgi:hypothetical protein
MAAMRRVRMMFLLRLCVVHEPHAVEQTGHWGRHEAEMFVEAGQCRMVEGEERCGMASVVATWRVVVEM